jgi:hypothetical protein
VENYPFIIKNISPSRKELRLVFDNDDNITLAGIASKMPSVVGVVDEVRENDEDGNLIQNGIAEEELVTEIHGVPVGGQMYNEFEGMVLRPNWGPWSAAAITAAAQADGYISLTGDGSSVAGGDSEVYTFYNFDYVHPNGTVYEIGNGVTMDAGNWVVTGLTGHTDDSDTANQGQWTTQTLEAYLMFVGSDFTRFPNVNHEPIPSQQLIVAYHNGQNWIYDNGDGFTLDHTFTPNSNDAVLARLFRPEYEVPANEVAGGITDYITYVSSIKAVTGQYQPSGFLYWEDYDINRDGAIDTLDRDLFYARGNYNVAIEIDNMLAGLKPYPFHNYQFDFVLTLLGKKGKDSIVPIMNYLFDDSDTERPYLVVKLLNPLPNAITRLSKVTIEQQILETSLEEITYIKGETDPFLKIPLDYDPSYVKGDNIHGPTAAAQNFNDLTSSFQNNAIYEQILSQSYDNLEIDYRDFGNHTFFGSAKRKLQNFKIKMSDIEGRYKEISQSLSISGSTEVDIRRQLLFNEIAVIKNQFTPYEKWLSSDGQLTTTGSVPGIGSIFTYVTPVNTNDLKTNRRRFGFNTVYEFTGSQKSTHATSSVSLFNDIYLVENQPFYNQSGSFYLSFLMLGDATVGQANQKVPEWKNTNLLHSPPIPATALYTQSILVPTASATFTDTVSTSSWNRYVYQASMSYYRPTTTNPVLGGAGGIEISGANQSNIELLTGTQSTGSYSIIAGGQYQNLATTITGSGALFTGSFVPAGELFNLTIPSSSQHTSSFITDIKITRNDPTNLMPFGYLHSTSSIVFTNWYNGWYDSASLFDTFNENSLTNNLPNYMKDDVNNEHGDMKNFVGLLGEHYDIIRAYITGLQTFNKRGYHKEDRAPANVLPILIQNTGWEASQIYSSSLLDYFGSQELQTETPKEITENYWNKTLNNIVPILKAKGTRNSLRYLLNVFGWPADVLRIKEHGTSRERIDSFSILTEDAQTLIDGVEGQTDNISFTQEPIDFYSYKFNETTSSKLDLDWWTNNATLNTFQFVYKGRATNNTQALVESSGSGNSNTGSFWDIRIVPSGSATEVNKSYGKIEFRLNYSLSGSGDITTNAFSMSSDYFLLKTSKFWNVGLVRQFDNTSYISGSKISGSIHSGMNLTTAEKKSGSITYKLFVGKGEEGAIQYFNNVSMSILSNNISGARANENWYSTGSNVSASRLLLGRTFTGSMAEVRGWTTPLSASKFKQHILNKQSVVGNFLTSSQDELTYHFKLNENHISASTTFKTIGDNMVEQPAFAADSGWNKNSNWTIADGVATADGTDNNNINQSTTIAELGKRYEISMEITELSQSVTPGTEGFYIAFGDESTGNWRSTGIHTAQIVATDGSSGAGRLKVYPVSKASGSVDNISIYEMTSRFVIKDSNPSGPVSTPTDYSITMPPLEQSEIPYDVDEIDRTAFTIIADGDEINDNNILIAPSSSLNYIDNLNPFNKSYLTLYDRLEGKRKASTKISIIRSPQDVIDNFFINNMSDFSISEMMGDPEDLYTDGYGELNKFYTDIVNHYGIRLEPNKYIRAQDKIFNGTLIERIQKILPARTSLEDIGIEFKPTLLEKNKIKGYAIEQERTDFEGEKIKILDYGAGTSVINIKQGEIQDVNISDRFRSKSSRKFLDIDVTSYITSSGEYKEYKKSVPITSFNPIDTDNAIFFSGSIPLTLTTHLNFFNQNESSASVSPNEVGRGRDLIKLESNLEGDYNYSTLRTFKSLENNNISSSYIQGINVLSYTQISSSYTQPFTGSIDFRDEIKNLFDYKDPKVDWGTTINDLHFVTYVDFKSSVEDNNNLKLLNRSHYETRYKFITIGDTQTVSASAFSSTGSLYTPFESASFFKGIENIEIDSTNGIRENGTTVRLIDTNGVSGIKNTNTGSNFGKYIDERYRYPNNHIHIVGTSNLETPSFRNIFFDGVQNGINTARDDILHTNVPETQDLNTGSFYTINVQGENTLTVN